MTLTAITYPDNTPDGQNPGFSSHCPEFDIASQGDTREEALALGDAIGLALARRMDAEFVTKDRSEIAPMEAAGFCRVLFIR
jgi:predicted RNase H-like HicB family nuclease